MPRDRHRRTRPVRDVGGFLAALALSGGMMAVGCPAAFASGHDGGHHGPPGHSARTGHPVPEGHSVPAGAAGAHGRSGDHGDPGDWRSRPAPGNGHRPETTTESTAAAPQPQIQTSTSVSEASTAAPAPTITTPTTVAGGAKGNLAKGNHGADRFAAATPAAPSTTVAATPVSPAGAAAAPAGIPAAQPVGPVIMTAAPIQPVIRPVGIPSMLQPSRSIPPRPVAPAVPSAPTAPAPPAATPAPEVLPGAFGEPMVLASGAWRGLSLRAATDLEIPIGLLVAVGVFLLGQALVDRRDPKVSAAPERGTDDTVGFQ